MATNTVATKQTHTAANNASGNTSGPYTISFDYLLESDVEVRVDNTLKTQTTHYTFPSKTSIQFTSGNFPTLGATIEIKRNTDITVPKVDFQDGSVLTETDLDNNSKHLLFGMQETKEDTEGLVSTFVGASAPTGSSIVNGARWYDTVSGRTFIYYVDTDTAQWVEANPPFDAAERVNDSSLVNFTALGTGAVTRTVDSKLEDIVSVKDFGAKGDGTTDDTTAIQNAINAAFASNRKDIHIPAGTYRTTATLVVNGTGVRIEGEGAELSTTILADFVGTNYSDSPVFKLDGRYQSIQSLGITSSSTREASSNNNASGIHVEASDTTSGNSWFENFSDLEIQKQSGNGILCVGMVILSTFERLKIHDCKQMGIRFDSGHLTSRTNKHTFGQNEIRNCTIYENIGHALLIGNENNDDVSNRGYRFNIINLDTFRNADAAGARLSETQVHAFCDTTTFENCAFEGQSRAFVNGVTRGLQIAGRSISVKNCRFLNCNTNAILIRQHTFGGTLYSSRDIEISGLNAFQTSPLANLNPAIDISSAIAHETINIDIRNRTDITSILSNTVFKPIKRECFIQTIGSTKTVNNTTTLTDTTLDIPLPSGDSRTYFRYVLYYRSDPSADIKFQFDSVQEGTSTTLSPAPTVSFVPVSSIHLNTSLNPDAENVKFSEAQGLIFGGEGTSATLVAEIVGEIRTNASTTNGTFKLQFTQNAAHASNTQILSSSHMMFWT